jgi:hypothetical protein
VVIPKAPTQVLPTRPKSHPAPSKARVVRRKKLLPEKRNGTKQKEAEERGVKEARERAAKEREIREAGERAGREAAERAESSQLVKCVVPRLVGDSLSEARRAITEAHCRLGKVHRPRRHHGALMVLRENRKTGAAFAAWTRVSMTLAPCR